jgi:hypothetical protein
MAAKSSKDNLRRRDKMGMVDYGAYRGWYNSFGSYGFDYDHSDQRKQLLSHQLILTTEPHHPMRSSSPSCGHNVTSTVPIR